jgi:demethylmenaquinone methyltransferase / 2-methoxy-6-polyprenyl-1,4-benzoquinol methylase
LSLNRRLATPEGKKEYVRSLFATIADRYDLITVVLSYGLDRRWKRRLVDLVHPQAHARSLDLATGTGDIAFLLCRGCSQVIGLDVTQRMVELARAKGSSAGRPAFLVGDMMTLPFADAQFDIVTTGYGLRNVPELTVALDEILRVLKTGGQALSLDFNRPANPVVRAVYLWYLGAVGSAMGWVLHRDPDTYRYIPASLRGYPGAEAMAAIMKARGFRTVTSYLVMGGLMVIHHAVK